MEGWLYYCVEGVVRVSWRVAGVGVGYGLSDWMMSHG